MANSKKGKRGFIRYKSYLFVDKDPIIDAFRTARSDKGLSYAELSAESGVSATTFRNWEHGKTRRPMFSTVMAAVNALGKKLVTKNGKPHLID